MASTSGVSPASAPRRFVSRVVVPLAALSLALSACTTSGPGAGPTAESTGTESPVQSPTPEPPASSVPASPTGQPAQTGPTADSTPAPSGSTPDAAATSATLTVSIQQDASSEPVQYVLDCVDGAPGPASTLPNAEAACARLAQLGTDFFTARPDKDLICTQQYGGPQTASITGDLDGTSVLASFALTDGCQISRWKQAQDILGAPGA